MPADVSCWIISPNEAFFADLQRLTSCKQKHSSVKEFYGHAKLRDSDRLKCYAQ